MRIAILGCENSWSVKRIIEEGEKRGHVVEFIRTEDIVIEMDPKLKVTVNGYRDMKIYDVLFRRRIVNNFMQSLVVASYMKRHNKVVISRGADIGQSLDDKMTQAIKLRKAGLPHLPTFQALSRKNSLRLLKKVSYPVIIKGLVGTKGKEVFKADSRSSALKILKKEKYHRVLIQEFINIKSDRRVFVVGKKVLGVMKRIIPEGSFKANVAQGATVKKVKLSKQVKHLALKAVKVLGYEIAGVDVIYRKKKPRILEVNASPGFKGFSEATGINVSEEMIKYIERRYKAHRIESKKKREKKALRKKNRAERLGGDSAERPVAEKDNNKSRWQKFIGTIWEK